jgi:hypothetical protein
MVRSLIYANICTHNWITLIYRIINEQSSKCE